MVISIYSANLKGIEGEIIKVEISIDNGIPSYNVVGLAGTAIKESGNRIKPAFSNTGIYFPKKRITVNLVPAGKKKDGSHFDLPIALGIMALEKEVEAKKLEDFAVIGELSLDGKINPIKGALPLAIKLIEGGKKKILLPPGNLKEVSLIKKGEFYPIADLENLNKFLGNIKSGETNLSSIENIGDIKNIETGIESKIEAETNIDIDIDIDLDYKDIYGQESAKRAFEIAAAGRHPLLMVGSPGVGKTMLAKRIPTILPSMNEDEILEVTQIYSVAGLLNIEIPVVEKRPFRSPHHRITMPALLGGGQIVSPGEISLAHNGVLFLDELSQFESKVLEGLREPLEEKEITIARVGGTVKLPANVLLVCATNPCKCGYLGDSNKRCTCTESQLNAYRNKFSGPLLDRIDIHIELARVEKKLIEKMESEKNKNETVSEDRYTSNSMKERIDAAIKIQEKRYKNENIKCNADMDNRQLKKYLNITKEGKELLDVAYENMMLSLRTYNKIKKVARTIADIEGKCEVDANHIGEALQYRMKV